MKRELFKLAALTLIALTLSFGSSIASAKDKQNNSLVPSVGTDHFEHFNERNAFTPGHQADVVRQGAFSDRRFCAAQAIEEKRWR